MSKPTIRDRAEARKHLRDHRRDGGAGVSGRGMPMDLGRSAPQTRVRTRAPGLADGPVSVPGGTVRSVDERTPRLPCPSCGFLISISLQDLITASGFTCPKCQTTLTMNRDASAEALRHVQTFYVAMKDLGMG